MHSRRWNQPSLGARLAAYAGLAFMHLPVLVIILYAFTTDDRTYGFPLPGVTLHWFEANTAPINRIVPPLMAALYAALATWHWRNPDRIVTTLWTGWVVGVVGLAAKVEFGAHIVPRVASAVAYISFLAGKSRSGARA